MEDRIGVGFWKARNTLVFLERGFKTLPEVPAQVKMCNHLAVLLLVKHWYFGFTAPAPKHLHSIQAPRRV
jgi:hypothetical protein